jgi:hypothetical protein
VKTEGKNFESLATRGLKEDAMADTVTKKDIDALQRQVDQINKTLDANLKYAETNNKNIDAINKHLETLDKNIDAINKNLEATKDWAKGELEKLAKAINSK